jgi:hypothetical protein
MCSKQNLDLGRGGEVARLAACSSTSGARLKRRLARSVSEASQEHQPTCRRPVTMAACSGAAGQRQGGSCSWLRDSGLLFLLAAPLKREISVCVTELN